MCIRDRYGKTPGDTPEYGKTPADTPSGQAPVPERPTSPWASAQPSAWDRGRSGAPRRRLRKDQKRERLAKYANEKLDSQFMVDHYAIAPAEQAVQNGESPSVREYLKANSGWSDDDVTRYYERREAGKVDYVDHERRRDELELHAASTFTQGPEGEVFDTSAMYSKFKGPGFGIYVMSPGGHFYADQHRVGLFHHTTFLEGGDVAGAGEICTDASGRLKHITNKSGHYIPTDDSMFYVLEALVARGVSLRGVGLTLLSRGPDNYPGGAQAFFEQHKAKVPGP